jgi:hypothetical protein
LKRCVFVRRFTGEAVQQRPLYPSNLFEENDKSEVDQKESEVSLRSKPRGHPREVKIPIKKKLQPEVSYRKQPYIKEFTHLDHATAVLEVAIDHRSARAQCFDVRRTQVRSYSNDFSR